MDPYHYLKRYNQWLLWSSIQKGNKTVKVPVNPFTGVPCNAHDPANWVSFEQAVQQKALIAGSGMAFSITAADDIFLGDMDGCKVFNEEKKQHEWSEIANRMMAALPGALVETSQSGNGLHVIGRYSALVEHACKNTANKLELYTAGRFIALGNMETAVGDSGAVVDLQPLVDAYFRPSTGSNIPWSNQPDPRWKGPTDNKVLLGAMMASGKKMKADVFGSEPGPVKIGATFADIWTNNIPVLTIAYPTQNDDDAYDRSSADAAMFAHLSFWTGRNQQRMWDLVWDDTLVPPCQVRRDKWTDRGDYVARSIAAIVAMQGNILGEDRPDPTPLPTAAAAASAAPVTASTEVTGEMGTNPFMANQPLARDGSAIIPIDLIPELFRGFVYLAGPHRMLDTRTGMTYSPQSFNALLGGRSFVISASGGPNPTPDAFKAYTYNEGSNLPRYHDTVFRPDMEPGAEYTEQGVSYINAYIPNRPRTASGDPSPALNHIRMLLPNGDDADILITWLAAVAQNPHLRFMWAPVLIGAEGNGKSWLASMIEYIIGTAYTHRPNARDLANKFNGWIPGTLLAVVDEINTNKNAEVMDALKALIGNERIEVQKKGVDAKTDFNFCKFMFMGNHLDGIPVTDDSRRFCMLVCNQMSADDVNRDFGGDYFPRLFDWTKNQQGMEIFANYLLNYKLDERYNPAGNCVRAPRSTTTTMVVKESLDHFQQYVINAVDEGRQGFCGGWISSNALTKLMKDIRIKEDVTPRQYRGKLKAIGYIPHPALPGGRANNPVRQEFGTKPVLYVKEGSLPALNIKKPSEAVSVFIKAQGYSETVSNNDPGQFENGQ